MSNVKSAVFNAMMRELQGRLLIPVQEATHKLGMKDKRLTLRLVGEGKLESRRVGNRIMITTQSLLEYVGA